MKHLTLTIDEETLQRAEQKAIVLNTSVSSVVTDYLRAWTNDEHGVEGARREMKARFTRPSWQFAVGTPDDREQRKARG